MYRDAELDASRSGEYEWEADRALGSVQESGVFSEADEIALATELLEVNSEAELDQFLGKLVRGAFRGIGRIARGLVRPLGGVLKAIGKKALPFLAGALGSVVPGVGTALGTAAGALISRALEAEFEGMEPEDREFEAARRFVRFAGAAAQNAAMAPALDTEAAIRAAIQRALREQYPYAEQARGRLHQGGHTLQPSHTLQSGRWVRRGRRIVIYGVE